MAARQFTPECSCSAPSPLPSSFSSLSFLLLPRPHLFIFPPGRDDPQPALLAAQVSPEGGVRKESGEVFLASPEPQILPRTCLESGTMASKPGKEDVRTENRGDEGVPLGGSHPTLTKTAFPREVML